MRAWVVAVAAAVAGGGGAVALAQTGAAPGTTDARPPLTPVDVTVVRRPTASSRWHPAKAFGQRIQGRASVACRVTEQGLMRECRATAEDPPGWGFGEALVRQAEAEVRIGPKARDGTAVAGRLFAFERVFPLGGNLPKSAMPLPKGQVGDDGLVYRTLVPLNADWTHRCFRREVGDPKEVSLKITCRSGAADTLVDCRVDENSRAPDARYAAAGLCAIQSSRMRVSRADGAPVLGAEVTVPLTYGRE